ncbi:MAG: glycosyltransferase family 4 protein [Deltaproteobacteria bacterium]|jgi:glycosyltransferase involved in cell wall biosynthesis|nr:glycosyltransferase family 4 protein [Deltaproteobacteria bacterium]
MHVTFFQRKPQEANYSIERLFDDVLKSFSSGVQCRVAISRFPSRGLFRRLYNIIEAVFRQGDVNHITGDVHFLTYLLRKGKTILTIHDLVSVERLTGFRKALFLFLWYRLPMRRVVVVTVISESTKKELLNYIKYEPQKIKVVYDCISDDFRPASRDFNVNKPIILQIGTEKNKNLARVATAIREMPCHLRIVGKLYHDQASHLREANIEYSSVYNISDEEILKEYQDCDMLVFASTYEGFGLPILEAQATGRPVVTSNILSMPEVAGYGACLVNPYDVIAIRQGLLKVINDTFYRNALVRNGFENVKRFRPKKIAAQYLELYEQIIKGSNYFL